MAVLAAAACRTTAPSAGVQPPGAELPRVKPAGRTAAVPRDADDPAIWVHPTNPSRSLILGTDKVEGQGGLYVFGLDGTLRQSIAPIDRPNNVDVEHGVRLGTRTLDVAVLTERRQHRLRAFAIDAETGTLSDLAPDGLPVLVGQQGEASEPMGVALYTRSRDKALFAIVAPKTGGHDEYLWQYRLTADAGGRLVAVLVRRFGRFSRRGAESGEIGEIEAVAADDALGFVYYSDERFGIRKYHADPDHPEAPRELAVFGQHGFLEDREGLAIYETGVRTGFVVASDQVPGGTRLKIYTREGTPGDPHDHREVRTVTTVSDDTDGLDATARPLPGFPNGLLVMMNAGGRNFLLYDWRDVLPPR
jgi:3-phytase